MVRAILIEISTSAPYRPGHRLLSDVTPEPQVNRSPPLPLPPMGPDPSLYWSLCGSRHHPVWPLIASLVHFTPVLYISPQSCTFHPSLVHFTPCPISGGHKLGTLQERATTQSMSGGGGQERTGKGGRGLKVICIYGSGVMSAA